MLRFIFARVGGGILVVLAATTIAFFLLRAAPGGPFDGEAKMSAEVKRNLEKSLQLDKPLYVQYATYITNVVQFDLGQSIKRRQTVNELIAKQFPYSLKLGAFALTFAVLFGVDRDRKHSDFIPITRNLHPNAENFLCIEFHLTIEVISHAAFV